MLDVSGLETVAKVGGAMALGGALITGMTLVVMETTDSGGLGWLPIIAIGAVPGGLGFDLAVGGLIGMQAYKDQNHAAAGSDTPSPVWHPADEPGMDAATPTPLSGAESDDGGDVATPDAPAR